MSYCSIDNREELDIIIETDLLNLVGIICDEYNIINNKPFEDIITKTVKILYETTEDNNYWKIMNMAAVYLDLINTKDIYKLKNKYMRFQKFVVDNNFELF